MKNVLNRLLAGTLTAALLAACAAPATVAPTAAPESTEAAPTSAPEATAAPEATTAPEATAAPVEAGATLRVGIGAEPETLDPGDAVMVQEQFVLINLFDSLLSMGPDASLHPALALSWQPNDDYSEFTFDLRKDVTFHDGTPFNAAAVKASFDHIMSDAVLESGGKTLLQDHQYVETVVVDDDTYGRMTPAEAHAEAMAVFEAQSGQGALDAIGQFQNAVQTPRASAHLDDILRAAVQGRVDALLLDESRFAWGQYDPITGDVAARMGYSPHPDHDDAEELMDLAASQTLLHRGSAYALPSKQMPFGLAIAAVYRY